MLSDLQSLGQGASGDTNPSNFFSSSSHEEDFPEVVTPSAPRFGFCPSVWGWV
jgi:hypothetical protein